MLFIPDIDQSSCCRCQSIRYLVQRQRLSGMVHETLRPFLPVDSWKGRGWNSGENWIKGHKGQGQKICSVHFEISKISFSTKSFIYYRPQMKFGEGNVFTGECLSNGVPRSLERSHGRVPHPPWTWVRIPYHLFLRHEIWLPYTARK